MYISCHFLSSFATPMQGYGGVLTKLQLWLSETNEKREGARLFFENQKVLDFVRKKKTLS